MKDLDTLLRNLVIQTINITEKRLSDLDEIEKAKTAIEQSIQNIKDKIVYWKSIQELPENLNHRFLTYSDDIDNNSRYRILSPMSHNAHFPSAVTHWMPLTPPEE
jgi:hypothetical protein